MILKADEPICVAEIQLKTAEGKEEKGCSFVQCLQKDPIQI